MLIRPSDTKRGVAVGVHPDRRPLLTHGWLVARVAVLLSLAACASPKVDATELPSQPTTAATIASPASLWISPGVPEELRTQAESLGPPIVSDKALASITLSEAGPQQPGGIDWFYALAAPFPTVLDGISATDLRDVWIGKSSRDYASWTLWMTEPTLGLLTASWGAPAVKIKTGAPDALADAAWDTMPSWAIVPFESLEPRWKVLTIDGQSPIHKDFDPAAYALRFGFTMAGANAGAFASRLPSTNREASRLSTVILTGTSALAREIAYQMEIKGVEYPARDIAGWLREADVLHVSHETSFDPTCPPPNPLKPRFFCSSPRYVDLFDYVGVDVVELTGNHILDNGAGSFLYSLDLYRSHHISYFGGGANLEEAGKPLLIEHHGNSLAFIGCNFAEPPQPLATGQSPGANPCDWPRLEQQIRLVKSGGYLPIVTLQYKEGYSPTVMPWQSVDFRRAAFAGAAIVSGSQSHVPLQMEFYEGAFVHYGLGNLFFGQMGNQPPGPGLPIQPAVRYEFIDRHVIYAGRHISTELLTAMLEDYARPRPMTDAERSAILEAYFAYSGWLPLVPTPAPAKTPTLYPLLKFVPLPTYTPYPTSTPRP